MVKRLTVSATVTGLSKVDRIRDGDGMVKKLAVAVTETVNL